MGTDTTEDEGIHFSVYRGDRVLIVGPSGCGKSSLVRAISGLWQRGGGSITWDSAVESGSTIHSAAPFESGTTPSAIIPTKHRGAPDGIFFLPQKPYNVQGSLRLQILYPAVQNETSVAVPDTQLLQILRKVKLENLADRFGGLDAVQDWSKVLSLGEQQRLAFARVLFNRPQVVVLDESTSALDLDSEDAMYQLLSSELDATYISIGHRPSLLAYHDKKIVLAGPGKPVQVLVGVTDASAKNTMD